MASADFLTNTPAVTRHINNINAVVRQDLQTKLTAGRYSRGDGRHSIYSGEEVLDEKRRYLFKAHHVY